MARQSSTTLEECQMWIFVCHHRRISTWKLTRILLYPKTWRLLFIGEPSLLSLWPETLMLYDTMCVRGHCAHFAMHKYKSNIH